MSDPGKRHIYPIFGDILGRAEKEDLLEQKGGVFWLTGLSGSGKSTIAAAVERQLHQRGYFVKLLDGDNIRFGINADLGFSPEDRVENIRRVAEVAKLFAQTGIIVLSSFISPTKAIREMAVKIIGQEDFHEIFVDTPLEICEQRDVKGLYQKARAGLIPDFTGIHQPFESPEKPALALKTADKTVDESAEELVRYILSLQPDSKDN
ncbi:MAG: adenylyl-sulfate kinase [Bacteroidia bacterium]|nr:adenylyl-sulfate kinase [Bacteroidia bacterium]